MFILNDKNIDVIQINFCVYKKAVHKTNIIALKLNYTVPI